MISYYNLGSHLKLKDIVIAGSHDAAITSGSKNVQTQNFDILNQAKAGVRFFDIRITGKSMTGGGVELRAFHSELKKNSTVTTSPGATVVSSKLVGGDWGMGLTDILQDARNFVNSDVGKNEFLILKFDKCANWESIADACYLKLAGCILKPTSPVNLMTLDQLKGKVICAFMPNGISEIRPDQKAFITPITNLYKPPSVFNNLYNGLQYWGAGGTSPFKIWKTKTGKLNENIGNQSKIFSKARDGIKPKKKSLGCPAASPNALGMMYWTSTGLFSSIKNRNDKMWSKSLSSDKKMAEVWFKLSNYMIDALPDHGVSTAYGYDQFFPNIIMIDFADTNKCFAIYKLNGVTPVEMKAALEGMWD